MTANSANIHRVSRDHGLSPVFQYLILKGGWISIFPTKKASGGHVLFAKNSSQYQITLRRGHMFVNLIALAIRSRVLADMRSSGLKTRNSNVRE